MINSISNYFQGFFCYTPENLPYYIHQALLNNDVHSLKNLCNQGISLQGLQHQGKPLLEHAISMKDDVREMSHAIEILIRAGANPKGYLCKDVKSVVPSKRNKDKRIQEIQDKWPTYKSLLFFVLLNYTDKDGKLARFEEFEVLKLVKIFQESGMNINEVFEHPNYSCSLRSLSRVAQLSKYWLLTKMIIGSQKKYFAKANYPLGVERVELLTFIYNGIKANDGLWVVKFLIEEQGFSCHEVLERVCCIVDRAEKANHYTPEFEKQYIERIKVVIDDLLKRGAYIDLSSYACLGEFQFQSVRQPNLLQAVATTGINELTRFLIKKGATIGEKKNPNAKFLSSKKRPIDQKIIDFYAKERAFREISPFLMAMKKANTTKDKEEIEKIPKYFRYVPLDIYWLIYQKLVQSRIQESTPQLPIHEETGTTAT